MGRWVGVGVGSWVVGGVVKGLVGSGGGRWIMNSLEEKWWGFMGGGVGVGWVVG